MSHKQVVDALVDLGMSLNEGRAYTALLGLGPSTGYEVSQRAEVPRSAVYRVLRKLVDAGYARSIAGSPERFEATPPKQLLELVGKRFAASQRKLNDAVASLDTRPKSPDAFSVHGYERVLEEAARIVSAAKSVLLISGWPRELDRLAEDLARAVGRGVYTVIFSHAALPADLSGVHFSYNLDERGLEAFGHHRLVVVADDRQVLMGATEQRGGDTAVISEAPAIAELASGQISLDITLLAQRHAHDVADVMAKVLGERVGRLDQLLPGTAPELGSEHGTRPRRR